MTDLQEKQKKNEAKVFDAIQGLKDAIFGLNNSYAEYCYSKIEEKHVYDEQKVHKFIEELLSCGKQSSYYSESLDELIAEFLELAIVFIKDACNFEDQQFVGLRKIAKTVQKNPEDPTVQSVFDIMIEDCQRYLSDAYVKRSQEFSNKMVDVDFDDFYYTVKHAIEIFIDNKNLNVMFSDEDTAYVVSRINRTTNVISLETRRIAKTNGVYDYD